MAFAMLRLAQDHSEPVDVERYGPPRTMTCTWFSNFENSRMEECHDAARKPLLDGAAASVECVNRQCALLDAEARRAAHWTRPEPVEGTFTVRLVGRASLGSHPTRYLGDGTRAVLIERILTVDLAR
jgi:hypothetical protein